MWLTRVVPPHIRIKITLKNSAIQSRLYRVTQKKVLVFLWFVQMLSSLGWGQFKVFPFSYFFNLKKHPERPLGLSPCVPFFVSPGILIFKASLVKYIFNYHKLPGIQWKLQEMFFVMDIYVAKQQGFKVLLWTHKYLWRLTLNWTVYFDQNNFNSKAHLFLSSWRWRYVCS